VQPGAYTKAGILKQFSDALDKLQFGQEIEVRRAKDRPSPTPSIDAPSEPAYATLAVALLIRKEITPRAS